MSTPKPPKPRGGSVKVRGTCTDGHVTETTSAPGRVTWEGVCAHEGCELKVKARRVPKELVPAEPDGGADTPPSTPHTVREVRYDVPQPKRAAEPEPVPAPQQQPEPEPEQPRAEPEQPPAPAPVDPDQPGAHQLVDEPRRRRALRRPRLGIAFRHPLD